MYDVSKEKIFVSFLSERHNHAYILLVWNSKLFEILLTILLYGDDFHKYILYLFPDPVKYRYKKTKQGRICKLDRRFK